ncbi:2'-5' RNA ligase [Candidatus Woesebacteria bacterium RIFCSPHIGHO2_01_FULL_38_10]|uniref:RNA 2',3'-cyclic phosphodiesterase n=1 Tax=Candidatus Woesebacteria bacterium RIFCSPLOWO2_01_FULL_39_10b TaxID=1802517 RepID=A0A1F8B6B1_9BACT|nr:MAG: 2'-5' RNA ligase [Candidatus Woesebacteria bacterium RIFCSPHIGHO2_01_FULL_38_10]OGM59582.1 MAG: 2'-5' RNA ligase [Candidatus Woesebacteria bacterium RIFCSPLOWO2_01_FULL_39_10b]
MKKRVFLGIPVSDRLKRKINNWINDNLAGFNLRIIPQKNLHITLIPPWYEQYPEKVISELDRFKAKTEPFFVDFKLIELGPTKKNPRLIWLRGSHNHNLIDLKGKLEKRLSKKLEKRELLPHITIARFKIKDNHKLHFEKLEKKISWKERVESFSFYESQLSSHGANYKVIENFLLPLF